MRDEYKKDYEPYQTMGPLCGIFDQRAAERLNHHADAYGFDAISVGGVLVLADGVPGPRAADGEATGRDEVAPAFSAPGVPRRDGFARQRRAGRGTARCDHRKRGVLDLEEGARKARPPTGPREAARTSSIPFVYIAYARKGWMVPNQYWTPGVLSPMAIMGKYYMYYGNDFVPPGRSAGSMPSGSATS